MMAKVRICCSNKNTRTKIRRTVLRLGLDRRRVYVLGYTGELAISSHYTDRCSGCSCDCSDLGNCGHGTYGCRECGYTGRRVRFFPEPVEINGRYIRIVPSDEMKPF